MQNRNLLCIMILHIGSSKSAQIEFLVKNATSIDLPIILIIHDSTIDNHKIKHVVFIASLSVSRYLMCKIYTYRTKLYT